MEKETKYVRCTECSFVYEDKLDECPQCNTPKEISEGVSGIEPVFNICD